LELQERWGRKEIEACREIREYKAPKEMLYVYINCITYTVYVYTMYK